MIMDKNQLQARRQVCTFAIGVLEQNRNDPRFASAHAEYTKQLAEIDQKIAALEAGSPPEIIIGMKTAVLFAKPLKG